MLRTKWGFATLLVVAGASFWLLLAGPERVLGVDLGGFGFGLGTLLAWASMYAVMAAPRGELDEAISPAETNAWVGLGFTLLIGACLAAKADAIAGATDLAPLAGMGRSIALLMVAWAALAWHLGQRWKGRVHEDERDLEIGALAGRVGRVVTIVAVLGVAVLLAFSPDERLLWATPIALAHLLLCTLLAGTVGECAVSVFAHWRDRRG